MSFVVFLALTAGLLALPQATADALVDEGGPIESLTVLLWFMGVAAASLAAVRDRLRRAEWIFGAFVMFLFAARELSWQTAVTGWSVARVESYFDPSIPALARLLAFGVVVVPTAVCLLGLVVRLGPAFRNAWRRSAPWAQDFPVWILAFIFSQALDKGHKLFPIFGFDIPVHYTRLVEENLEMTLAMYMVLLLWPLAVPSASAPVAAARVDTFAASDERAA